MDDRPFVHLHCHTHYSLLDGANRIPELVAHVKNQGMNAVAITDHGNLFGAIEFYHECTAASVNPGSNAGAGTTIAEPYTAHTVVPSTQPKQ